VKLYQKLTLITAILGLVVPLLGVFAYVFINSLTGIPILALFLGTAFLIAVVIIATNTAAIVAVFYIKNTKLVGAILICCGIVLFLTVQIWGIPGLALYIVSGIMALREKRAPPARKYTIKCLTCGKELKDINNPDFAKDHLAHNPTHLEYRVFVEILFTTNATRKFP
jgi:predicted membrane protein